MSSMRSRRWRTSFEALSKKPNNQPARIGMGWPLRAVSYSRVRGARSRAIEKPTSF
jgi:hypothetical protein